MISYYNNNKKLTQFIITHIWFQFYFSLANSRLDLGEWIGITWGSLSELGCRIWIEFMSVPSVFTLESRLRWLRPPRTHSYQNRSLAHKEPSPIVQTHSRPLLVSHLQPSNIQIKPWSSSMSMEWENAFYPGGQGNHIC